MDVDHSFYAYSESEHASCVYISVDELCGDGVGPCHEGERDVRDLELATSLVEPHTGCRTLNGTFIGRKLAGMTNKNLNLEFGPFCSTNRF